LHLKVAVITLLLEHQADQGDDSDAEDDGNDGVGAVHGREAWAWLTSPPSVGGFGLSTGTRWPD
ncbi:MAG TPA: hypothetical protein VK968_03190, partial [Roseimicrobium sp.]|nr:hypothetical protein [Roseimicrobium sp.]